MSAITPSTTTESAETQAPGSVVLRSGVERLRVAAFHQLAGKLAGQSFVKVVVDRHAKPAQLHFINHAAYPFHADYIAARILHIGSGELDRNIDDFNWSVYLDPERRFFLGIISLQGDGQGEFFSLETVEIDNMGEALIREFYAAVQAHLDAALPLLFKPASHLQETILQKIDPAQLPRVFSHEIFSSAQYIALNPGTVRGRLRAFRTVEEYRRQAKSLEWYDIIVMHRVPDDIPRLSGIINAHHTTPLSHTNVLASNWQVPNAIQIGIFDRIERENIEGKWVTYAVDANASQIGLTPVEGPVDVTRPAWTAQRIHLEEPETVNTPIVGLERLRMSDRYRYGTKAANLGELSHVLAEPGERILGFYKIRRAPRPNLLPHLAKALGQSESASAAELAQAAGTFLRETIQAPRGIAIPFSVQQAFLESSPRIQQAIGKLKMALELGAREIDALCLNLQALIRQARIPESTRLAIDAHIADQLAGVSSFVVRSSSNAEDLERFSAAGIYESINHVTSADKIFESIKEVWASLVSPRSVRLRHEVGISLDDCYMGVIVQEELPGELGGVLVTTNPLAKSDFRNVYINASTRSVSQIVQGTGMPLQYLYNTVEGGGRTLSLGDAKEDLSEEKLAVLAKLALAGRLLQSHFSPDYTFSVPVDIEWLANSEGLFIVQLRPYTK